jgi:uncharacterized protein involved in tolerance to divalent cations
VLPDWMNNVVEAENLKATIKTMDSQSNDFKKNMQNMHQQELL